MIKVENLTKKYGNIVANDSLNFEIKDGEFVVILGASGAGKSTLLNILGGIELADSGNFYVDLKNITKLNDRQLTMYRRKDVGFVFQFYNLIPNLTAIENVELACELVKDSINAKDALELVGLGHRLNNFPSELSGGEQQRVSIARAIAKKPKILLCDEPTGALDYKTGIQVIKLIKQICDETKTTVILITHNKSISLIADRVIEIASSKIKKEYYNENKLSIDEIEW